MWEAETMKNLKVRVKLIVSFLIVLVLAVVVGGVGILGMSQINAADDALYRTNLLAIQAAGDIRGAFYEQRVQIRNIVIYDSTTDMFKNAVARVEAEDVKLRDALKRYEPTIGDNQEDRDNFEALTANYENFRSMLPNMIAMGTANRSDEAMAIMTDDLTPLANLIDTELVFSNELNAEVSQKAVDDNTALFMTMTIIELVVLAVAVGVAIFLAMYISGIISRPLNDMMGYIKQAGETGNLLFRDDEWANCDRLSQSRDEIGQTMKAFTQMMRKFVYYGEAVNTVAHQDLSAEVTTLGANDTFGNAITMMLNNLNDMFGEINASTAQVATGSKQIADGAQALAQGSTEQAAAVEQLSSSISEIAGKTKENADMAGKAAALANTIKHNAEKGSNQMGQMTQAVKEINEASQAISKVIKTIDDIAFQTNILALNAAVEAARAGQHGKGFAVVAEEVRNLASKSAEAAKDTGTLIANSMEKAVLGAKIADETAASLHEIVAGINESSQIVGDIATSSEEQSQGITQINKGIDQVAQVVQQNSATSEESAAAAQEMSSQSNVLEELISQFQLRGGARRSLSAPASQKSQAKQLDMPERTVYAPSGGDYGKY
jgi:methyl-accepting chemotaxis protein